MPSADRWLPDLPATPLAAPLRFASARIDALATCEQIRAPGGGHARPRAPRGGLST